MGTGGLVRQAHVCSFNQITSAQSVRFILVLMLFTLNAAILIAMVFERGSMELFALVWGGFNLVFGSYFDVPSNE